MKAILKKSLTLVMSNFTRQFFVSLLISLFREEHNDTISVSHTNSNLCCPLQASEFQSGMRAGPGEGLMVLANILLCIAAQTHAHTQSQGEPKGLTHPALESMEKPI